MLSAIYPASLCLFLGFIVLIFRFCSGKIKRPGVSYSSGVAVVIADRGSEPGHFFITEMGKMGFTVLAAFQNEKVKRFSKEVKQFDLDMTQEEYSKKLKIFIEESLHLKDVCGPLSYPQIIIWDEKRTNTNHDVLRSNRNKPLKNPRLPSTPLAKNVRGKIVYIFDVTILLLSPATMMLSLSKRTLNILWRRLGTWKT